MTCQSRTIRSPLSPLTQSNPHTLLCSLPLTRCSSPLHTPPLIPYLTCLPPLSPPIRLPRLQQDRVSLQNPPGLAQGLNNNSSNSNNNNSSSPNLQLSRPQQHGCWPLNKLSIINSLAGRPA